MDDAALIDKLIQQDKLHKDDYLGQPEELKRYLIDMLVAFFDTYHRTRHYDRIDLPEVYVQFLLRSNRAKYVMAGGPYGMMLFGWQKMLHSTYYWANLYQGEEQDRFWISIGEQDKHLLFMCCDVKSPLFGTVVDFYDATPWIEDSSLPDSPEKNDEDDVYGTFTQLMESMLET